MWFRPVMEGGSKCTQTDGLTERTTCSVPQGKTEKERRAEREGRGRGEGSEGPIKEAGGQS